MGDWVSPFKRYLASPQLEAAIEAADMAVFRALCGTTNPWTEATSIIVKRIDLSVLEAERRVLMVGEDWGLPFEEEMAAYAVHMVKERLAFRCNFGEGAASMYRDRDHQLRRQIGTFPTGFHP